MFQNVINVFNDKVVAALNLEKKFGTARFIQQVLQWWNTVNVKSKGEVERFNNPNRDVQTRSSTNLQEFLDLFNNSSSGYGCKRFQSITHDTKKALVQTMEGLLAATQYLLNTAGFDYVLLGQLQSDRIEWEFSVYRQMTGGNAFMAVKDVSTSFKKRFSVFSAKFLESLHCHESSQAAQSHMCREVSFDEANVMENVHEVPLTNHECNAAAYVAGWMEVKTPDLMFSEEDLKIEHAKDFIVEVSRGKLSVPHVKTIEMVKAGLCYMKSCRHQVCCAKQLISVLNGMNFDFGVYPRSFFRRLANVLLSGLHKLEKDQQANAVVYQTSIKKARLS